MNLFISASAVLWLFVLCLIVGALVNGRNFGFNFLGQKVIVVGHSHYDDDIYKDIIEANRRSIDLNREYSIDSGDYEVKYPYITYGLNGGKFVTHGFHNIATYERIFGHKYPGWEKLEADISMYKKSKIGGDFGNQNKH